MCQMNGKAGAAFRHSRSLAEDIHRMACNARQVRAFTGGEMVFQIQGEGVSVHRVDLVAQKQGAAVGGHIVQPRYREHGHQRINVLFAHQLEQILWLGAGGKRPGVQQPVPHIFGNRDIAAAEALVQKAAVGDDISGKDNAARLCDADRLPPILNTVWELIIRLRIIRSAAKRLPVNMA